MSTRTKHIIGVVLTVGAVVANWVFGPGGPGFKTGVSAAALVSLLTEVKTALGATS